MKNKSHTPSAEIYTQMILETFRFNGLLIAAGDRLVNDLGLTTALWKILGPIEDSPLSMAQIARRMGLTRQSVRRSVNILIEKGLVEFKDNLDHKRAKLVALTKQGQSVLEKVNEIQIEWSNHIARDLSADELKKSVQILTDFERSQEE